jgi:hypothetical protein
MHRGQERRRHMMTMGLELASVYGIESRRGIIIYGNNLNCMYFTLLRSYLDNGTLL